MNRNLEALLKWSTENTDTTISNEDANRPQPKKLDPAVIDAILGKSDAQRMLECVRDLKSSSFSTEQKLYIWDELELLVESLDNANDLESIKIWEPIWSFVASDSSELQDMVHSCWTCGIAIQNNPKSQNAFLKLVDPIPRLLHLLNTNKNAELRSKLMYTLSGALRHNEEAMERFTALDGWSTLLDVCLNDHEIATRRKTVFLINTLFATVNDKESATAEEAVQLYDAASVNQDLLQALISSISKDTYLPTGANGDNSEIDIDFSDKTITTIITVINTVGTERAFKQHENLQSLQTLLSQMEHEDRIPSDLAQQEWSDFKKLVSEAV